MNRKQNESFTRLVVGAFMIAVISLLGYFTIVVSGVDLATGRSRVRIKVVFGNVGGLKSHDSVMYRGTKVGTVEGVAVTPTNLVVTADVDENVVLRSDCRITVGNVSMLGGTYLQLEEGNGEPMQLSATLFRGETATDWMQDVSRIARTLNEIVNSAETHAILSNVVVVSAKSRQIADRVDAVVSRIERGEGVVGRLTSSDESLYVDLRHTVSNVNDITSRLGRGEGLVGRLLSSDTSLYANLESTVSNVNDIVGRVNRGEGLAGRILSDDERLFNDIRDSVAAFRKACESFDLGDARNDFRAIASNGNRLIENLNAVAERLRNGQGTLGKLANEPDMYNEVQGLIKDCRQVIDNYRDTTPISTFSSILTGAL